MDIRIPAGPRGRAAQALWKVWQGQTLDDALNLEGLSPKDHALAQWLAYGAVRWCQRLDVLLSWLLERPLKPADQDLRALLLVGLFELDASRTPAYATVSAMVDEARQLKDWAAGLVNALLRRYLREGEALRTRLDAQVPAVARSHPAWLVECLQAAYPQDWLRILDAGNSLPPMVLRVNRGRLDPETYLRELREEGIEATLHPRASDAVVLTQPVSVERLPGWRDGWISVQDAAPQAAMALLDAQPGERVLDACAAPGGKAAHILEHAAVNLWAIDISAVRLRRVEASLERLGLLPAHLLAADATQPEGWWDGQLFDRILLDAPCSGTGVIRRHPDIKLLRRASDIAKMAAQQARLLQALWPLLKPGGRLVYATCSILPDENQARVDAFLSAHPDALTRTLSGTGQILPGVDGMDGFFYAVIEKEAM